jgi:hypothetical protein
VEIRLNGVEYYIFRKKATYFNFYS